MKRKVDKCWGVKILLEWMDNFIIRFIRAHITIMSSYFWYKHKASHPFTVYKYQKLFS